uniref:Uncharacterized protein n=1 Tax=Rhizophora mucronata TaxID=61149 RepID=A0A2P2N8C7_RHIMU
MVLKRLFLKMMKIIIIINKKISLVGFVRYQFNVEIIALGMWRNLFCFFWISRVLMLLGLEGVWEVKWCPSAHGCHTRGVWGLWAKEK